jgi:hypothetical protein
MQNLISNEKSIYWLQTILVKGYKGAAGNFVPSCKEPLEMKRAAIEKVSSTPTPKLPGFAAGLLLNAKKFRIEILKAHPAHEVDFLAVA